MDILSDTETAIPKRRRSVPLTKDEYKAFREYRKTFNTGVECAESIGISRLSMLRVLQVGSGAPETIEKIRLVLPTKQEDGESL